MVAMAATYLVAAVLPWFNLLWWNRAKPVLGPAWQKWLFVGPAALWILALTVFPLAYAIRPPVYAFRSGRIVKDIGWGNYRKLFNDVLFDPATRGPGDRAHGDSGAWRGGRRGDDWWRSGGLLRPRLVHAIGAPGADLDATRGDSGGAPLTVG